MPNLELERDDDAGYWLLREDGIGLAKSKSRAVMVRIRAALSAPNALIGLTVRWEVDTVPSRAEGYPQGVVLGLDNGKLVVQLPDDKLDAWPVSQCRVVAAKPPAKSTPTDDPADIYIGRACLLLQHWLGVAAGASGVMMERIAEAQELQTATGNFLAARKAAEPVP